MADFLKLLMPTVLLKPVWLMLHYGNVFAMLCHINIPISFLVLN